MYTDGGESNHLQKYLFDCVYYLRLLEKLPRVHENQVVEWNFEKYQIPVLLDTATMTNILKMTNTKILRVRVNNNCRITFFFGAYVGLAFSHAFLFFLLRYGWYKLFFK